MSYIGSKPTAVPLTGADIEDGTITTSDLQNNAVNATKLDLTDDYAFTGTITGAGGGKVLQIVGSENTATNSYAGAEGTEYIIQDSSGDWETSITINQGSKIYMSFFMNLSKDADDANYFILGKYNVDGGSFVNMANPVSLGSRRQSMIAGNRPYSTGGSFTTPVSGSFVFTPTVSGSTGIIRVKFAVVQTAGGARDIYFNYSTDSTDEGFTSVAHCALMEVE